MTDTATPTATVGFTEPTWNLNAICICSHEARRHHPRGHTYAFSCSLCSCLYMETPPIGDARPLDEALMDAIRCTSHITDDRALRARYIIQDLKLRGWQFQRITRDERGRFAWIDR
jgi:hypothetical protein